MILRLSPSVDRLVIPTQDQHRRLGRAGSNRPRKLDAIRVRERDIDDSGIRLEYT